MDGWLTAGGRKLVLGMVHLSPLPGTPFHEDGSFGRTLDTAVRSARAPWWGRPSPHTAWCGPIRCG